VAIISNNIEHQIGSVMLRQKLQNATLLNTTLNHSKPAIRQATFHRRQTPPNVGAKPLVKKNLPCHANLKYWQKLSHKSVLASVSPRWLRR